jgi:SSS family solute:Na+ symporter
VTLIVGLTGFIVVPLRRMKVMTIPEFYGRRFGPKTRILGAIMLVFGGVLNMGLFLKVGSMFVVGITGLEPGGAAVAVVMIVLLALVLVYTVLGGMVSVIVTDYVQFVVLSFGLILTCILATSNLGWDHIFETVTTRMGDAGFNPFVEEGTFGFEYVVWMAFMGLVGCAIWQTAVMRALAAENVETVKRQYMLSSVSFMIRNLIPQFLGICALVYIVGRPELSGIFRAEEGGATTVENLYAVPLFLGRILPIGLIGLVTAAMLAAFMSTHDSYLLCWSSVITQDIVAPLMGEKLAPKKRILLTRILIVVIGLYVLYWGLVYEGTDDIWDYMAVTGAIYFTGAFSLLLFGLYWKRASSAGAVAALVCGLSAILGLSPVQELFGFKGKVSSAWVGLGTVCLSLVAMVIGSLLLPDGEKLGKEPGNGDLGVSVEGAAGSRPGDVCGDGGVGDGGGLA